MRNGKLRGLLITVMLLVFLAGLASILYPYMMDGFLPRFCTVSGITVMRLKSVHSN